MIWFWVISGFVVLIGLSVFTGAPYVPTHRRRLRALFASGYPLDSTSVLFDIGSGDGVVLREVARHGAKAVGVEIHPLLAILSYLLSWRERGRVSVRIGNGWTMAFPTDTTAVYTFSTSRDIRRVHKRVEEESRRLKRSLDLISYGVLIPGVKPKKSVEGFHIYTVDGAKRKSVPLQRVKP